MPAWLIPALKAVLPHLGTIVTAAAPVFTKKAPDAIADKTTFLQQQVSELQAAASANDTHIKELAAQIQNTIEVLEKGASLAEWRHRRIWMLCVTALVFSAASVCVALLLILYR